MSNVTNHNIADMAAIRLNMPRYVVHNVMREIMQIVGEELANGNNVTFNRYWSVQQVQRQAHKARNPRTGEPVYVPERTTLKLRKRSRLWNYQDNQYAELAPEVYKNITQYREKHSL